MLRKILVFLTCSLLVAVELSATAKSEQRPVEIPEDILLSPYLDSIWASQVFPFFFHIDDQVSGSCWTDAASVKKIFEGFFAPRGGLVDKDSIRLDGDNAPHSTIRITAIGGRANGGCFGSVSFSLHVSASPDYITSNSAMAKRFDGLFFSTTVSLFSDGSVFVSPDNLNDQIARAAIEYASWLSDEVDKGKEILAERKKLGRCVEFGCGRTWE